MRLAAGGAPVAVKHRAVERVNKEEILPVLYGVMPRWCVRQASSIWTNYLAKRKLTLPVVLTRKCTTWKSLSCAKTVTTYHNHDGILEPITLIPFHQKRHATPLYQKEPTTTAFPTQEKSFVQIRGPA
jgi:hypothetical protein